MRLTCAMIIKKKKRKKEEKKAESKTKLSNEKDCILNCCFYSGYKASIEVPALAASLLKVIFIPP